MSANPCAELLLPPTLDDLSAAWEPVDLDAEVSRVVACDLSISLYDDLFATPDPVAPSFRDKLDWRLRHNERDPLRDQRDPLRRAALAHANLVRHRLALAPVAHLLPGNTGDPLECPLVKTIKQQVSGLYVVVASGITRTTWDEFRTQLEIGWPVEVTEFVRHFDSAHWHDLIA